MRFPLRKALLSVLAIIILGGLAYVAMRMKDFSWDKLETSLKQANWPLLMLALLGIHVCLAIRAFRWTRFSRYLARARFSTIYTATVMGFSAIFLLGRAGEPIRPLLIARKDRVSVSSQFGIYVLERMFDMASTVVLAAVALLAVQHRTTTPEGKALIAAARTSGIVLLVGLAAGVAFLIYLRVHGAAKLERRLEAWRVSSPIGWRKRVAGLLAGFSQGLQAIRSFNDLLLAVVISGAHWTLMGGVYYLIAQSFGGRLAGLTLTDAILVLAFTMAGSTIQLPGVGGGSQVASFLAYTVILGIPNEPAAAAAIVVWLITFAGSTVLGIPLLIKEGWSMGELRRMVRAEKDAEAHGRHIAPPAPEKAKSTAGDSQA
ncbi:MAG TPA: lysylphosphatidylglycerol synthase transmembrane domain-containing protein [Candidatus Acidoferrales bacterium]|nr:lysylphosphatidylglycerol synthase transmembrane domain-containing protein [Candidatus Acidoferrales bacterium]